MSNVELASNGQQSLWKQQKRVLAFKVGLQFAKREMDCLLEQYELYKEQLEQLDQELEALVETIPGAKEMMNIPGLGATTVALFFAEVGDITKYSSSATISESSRAIIT